MGYLPRDLLMSAGFVRRSGETLARMARGAGAAPPLLVGVATPNPCDIGRPLFNSAVLLRDGAVGPAFHKTLLPTYDVFDEDRYFEPAPGPQILELEWLAPGHQHLRRRLERPRFLAAPPLSPGPHRDAGKAGAPGHRQSFGLAFHGGQADFCASRCSSHMARKSRSAAGHREPGGRQRRPDLRRPQRRLRCARAACSRAPRASRKTWWWWTWTPAPGAHLAEDDFDAEAEIWNALVLGVRDYARKTRFRKVLLGLSGGIDSALTAAIAADALGAGERPRRADAVLLLEPRAASTIPLELARNLGIRTLDTADLRHHADLRCRCWRKPFAALPRDVTEENIQSRIRGNLLMALSNKFGSPAAHHRQQIGNGGGLLHPLRRHERRPGGDRGPAEDDGVPRGAMAQPARGRTFRKRFSPRRRRPSCGPDQTDQDSLPPYELLDQILELHVEQSPVGRGNRRQGLRRSRPCAASCGWCATPSSSASRPRRC